VDEKDLSMELPELEDLESEFPAHATPAQVISIGQLKAKHAPSAPGK